MKQLTNSKAAAVDLKRDLQVSNVRIRRTRPGSKFVAHASVTFFGQFVIKGLRLSFKDGLPWIVYPAEYPESKSLPKRDIFNLSKEAKAIVRAAVATAYSMVFNGHEEDVSFEYNEDKDFLPETTLDFLNCSHKRLADVTISFAGVTIPGISYIRTYKGEDKIFYPNFPEFKHYTKPGEEVKAPAPKAHTPSQIAHPTGHDGARELILDEVRRVYGEMTGNVVATEVDADAGIVAEAVAAGVTDTDIAEAHEEMAAKS